MATLLENANRIKTDKENIRQAIISKGIDVPENVSLDNYDEKINEIKIGDMKIYSVYADITAGTWTGAKLSDSSWVNFTSGNSSTSTWTYNFDRIIDHNKIQFVSFSMFEPTYYIRQGRGYAENSNTAQYQYAATINIIGNNLVPKLGSESPLYMAYDSDSCSTQSTIRNNSLSSTSSSQSLQRLYIYDDRIFFQIWNDGRNYGAIHSTTPKFLFTIGYTE